MLKFIERITIWMVETYGYLSVIRIKDIILGLGMFSLGCLVISFLIGRFFYRVEKANKLEKISFVKLQHDQKEHYFANPHSWSEAVEIMLVFAIVPFAKFLHKKEYVVANSNRTRRFIHIMFVVAVIFMVMSLFFMCYKISPNGHFYPY